MRIINKAKPTKLLYTCGKLLESLKLLFRQMKYIAHKRESAIYKENKGLGKFIYAFSIKI